LVKEPEHVEGPKTKPVVQPIAQVPVPAPLPDQNQIEENKSYDVDSNKKEANVIADGPAPPKASRKKKSKFPNKHGVRKNTEVK
jgi:hypothetical protein